MLVTPEEAKTKWCQQTLTTPDAADKCQGPDCMAWRWVAEVKLGLNPHGGAVLTDVKRGQCGLPRGGVTEPQTEEK